MCKKEFSWADLEPRIRSARKGQPSSWVESKPVVSERASQSFQSPSTWYPYLPAHGGLDRELSADSLRGLRRVRLPRSAFNAGQTGQTGWTAASLALKVCAWACCLRMMIWMRRLETSTWADTTSLSKWASERASERVSERGSSEWVSSERA